MNLLAIETSGPVLSVAVKKGKQKVREAAFAGNFRHVENLLPLIDRLLKKEKLKIKDINVFLISRGPGSFTGLRVGFATLKGFLAVRPRPCFGARSFDLVAAGIKPEKGGNLAVCLNAKRDKLYTCSYRYHKQGWKAQGTPSAVSPEAWFKELSEETRVAGDGLKLHLNALPAGLIPLPKKFWVPRASTLISLYERKDPLLKRLDRPKEFLPVYLRASEAEERLKNKLQ
jgi:tRNA threonylcarbamoyladenosine biosynthesis protein TsaB